MTCTANQISESEKVAIISKLAHGLSIKTACQLYGIDIKSIRSWQIQFAGGQVSYAERIRLMELQIAQLKKQVAKLELDNDC